MTRFLSDILLPFPNSDDLNSREVPIITSMALGQWDLGSMMDSILSYT